MNIKYLALIIPILLTACATTGIAPSYVNPQNYAQHTCQSLHDEIRRIESLAVATEKQNVPLSATGLGIGITGGRYGIHPTVSFGVGTGNGSQVKKERLAKLYGEHDAMVIAGRQKGCAFAQTIKIYGE